MTAEDARLTVPESECPTLLDSPTPALAPSKQKDIFTTIEERAASGDPCTDLANAHRFVDFVSRGSDGPFVRFVPPWGKWLVWDEKRWAPDEIGMVWRIAEDVALEVYYDAATARDKEEASKIAEWAKKSASEPRLRAMLSLSEKQPSIPILPRELDIDPWALNLRNGTIDLKTGILRKAQRKDHITKIAPVTYNPTAEAPTWGSFLARILPDPGVRAFVRRAAGIALTGDVSEQVLYFAHGSGANGKSTFLGALQGLLGGDYAMQAPSDLLLATRERSHPTEVADLFGKRLVVCTELGAGRSWNEALLKHLTGGDRIRARRMREDFWEFAPTHKLWIAANHKPTVRGNDHAFWRRMMLIPFTVTVPEEEQDPHLPEKLKAEASGVLRWALEGLRDWLEVGLDPPEAVLAAVREYRDSQDTIGIFLAEECIEGPQFRVQSSTLFRAFQKWAEDRGYDPGNQTSFSTLLEERGFRKKKVDSVQWLGLGLRSQREEREAREGF